MTTILKSVLTFKQSSEHYLKFIEKATNLLEENHVNAEKISVLRLIYLTILEELLLFDETKIDDQIYFNVFYEFLKWPIVTSIKVKSTEVRFFSP